MPNRALFENFGSILIFLFSALISAVDPVAVIAVFEEIHVNEMLFITVFGEALFNDGITVVLYQMFRKFVLIGADNLVPIDYVAGGISFFVIGLGGAAIGTFYAFIVSFITKLVTVNSKPVLQLFELKFVCTITFVALVNFQYDDITPFLLIST
ncbi:unnamed protein product [Gongylonema pulchrum]|uniref:Na_H_Exchanger domain-containing protein n=1 Tax=Gongylonema pulchrum TaxID=637853 RepID=A0A183D944_9BILA|nr:unnamed protein product [Gongylonema pulchrum]